MLLSHNYPRLGKGLNQHNLDYCNCCKRDENKLKGKKNAYFEFQNDGFILSTLFFLLPAIYTPLYQHLTSSTNFCIFC